MRRPRLSVVVVTWNSAAEIGDALAALESELTGKDELIVIDNGSGDGTADVAVEHSDRARIIRNAENRGFVVAVNQGAEMASNDLLVLLNPDAVVEPGWRQAILRPWTKRYEWGAWQGLVTTGGGQVINSAGNEIHFTGVSWAGGSGRPVRETPTVPREIGYASGACLAVPLELWRGVGGFPERLFMYGDDVDLCLRLRLQGFGIGIEPAARVEHAYEFEKGRAKWRYLERSRWAFLIRTYPRPLLVRVAPALLLAEPAIWLVALKGGWLGAKAASTLDVIRWLPGLLSERRRIQAERTVPVAKFASAMTPDLDSVYLGAVGRSTLLRRALRRYWQKAIEGL